MSLLKWVTSFFNFFFLFSQIFSAGKILSILSFFSILCQSFKFWYFLLTFYQEIQWHHFSILNKKIFLWYKLVNIQENTRVLFNWIIIHNLRMVVDGVSFLSRWEWGNNLETNLDYYIFFLLQIFFIIDPILDMISPSCILLYFNLCFIFSSSHFKSRDCG